MDPVRARTMRFRATLVEHQYEFVQEMVCHKEEWSAFVKRQLAKKIQPVIGPECTVGEFFKENRSFFGAWEEALQKQLPIEEVFSIGKAAFQGYFAYLDSLGMAIQIKEELLHRGPFGLSHLATYEEIVEAMQGKNFVTVHYEEHALGVIYAEDVHRRAVATSSWNDFSNSKETDAREEVEVISFIDHHKSDVRTARPAFGVVRADAQSSNSIVARISFDINDRYSTGGNDVRRDRERVKKGNPPAHYPAIIAEKAGSPYTRGPLYCCREGVS